MVFYLALVLTLLIRYGSTWANYWPDHFIPFSLICLFCLIVFYIIGLYDLALARNNLFFFVTLSKALLINAIASIALFYFIPYFGIAPKTNLVINLFVFALFFTGWRQLYNHFIKNQSFLNNVLIIEQNQETKELIKYIKDNPQMGYCIKKVVSAEEVKILHDLTGIITGENIQIVLTSDNPHKDKSLVRNLYQCIPLKITVTDLPSFYEKITGKILVSAIEEVWFLENMMEGQRIFFETAKKLTDIIFSVLYAAVTAILIPFIALLIKLDSPGPIIYRQKRVGKDNRIFEIIKFRTMIKNAEKNGVRWTTEKDERITRIGKYLRKTRLDEIPQLWNIIRGDMSFVGPRPERPEFAFSNDLLSQIPFYQVRHTIKPGLTGWAQIKYPYSSSIEDTLQKLQYDLFYIKNRSLILDTAIVLKTVKIILSGGGR